MWSNCTIEIMLAGIRKWTHKRKITTSNCSSSAHLILLFEFWMSEEKKEIQTQAFKLLAIVLTSVFKVYLWSSFWSHCNAGICKWNFSNTICRELFAPFYLRPVSPSLSAGEFKTWWNPSLQIIALLTRLHVGKFKRGQNCLHFS